MVKGLDTFRKYFEEYEDQYVLIGGAACDVLRITAELLLEKTESLPASVKTDIDTFIASLENEPFDDNSLKNYGLKNQKVIEALKRVFD